MFKLIFILNDYWFIIEIAFVQQIKTKYNQYIFKHMSFEYFTFVKKQEYDQRRYFITLIYNGRTLNCIYIYTIWISDSVHTI